MTQIDHPSYYNKLTIECIDVVENFNFNVGNAIKYLWRAGLKDGVDAGDDYAKAIWYIKREQQRLIKHQKGVINREDALTAYNNFN